MRISLSLISLALVLAASAAPLEKTFSKGPVEAVVRIEPASVPLTGDMEFVLSLRATPPISARVGDDELADRFEGLSETGRYTDEDGLLHIRLLPNPTAPRHRVKPFVVHVSDASVSPPAESWFATQSIELSADVSSVAPASTVSADGLGIVRVAPSFRSVARVALFVAAGLLAAFGLFCGLRLIHRRVSLAHLTPRERALRELRDLLEKDLPSQGRFKDYYVELTLVVRRYVGRRYGIRASRQTTEEFLRVARGRTEFTPDTLARLALFLQSADLIKFAGAHATAQEAAAAADKAADYLQAEREDSAK